MTDLPRILLCSFDVVPGPTGSSRRLTEYMKGLSDRFQVVGLTVKTPDHSHIERYHGARLLRVPVGSGDLSSRLMAFDRAVRRQLESEDYVLAHFTDPFGGYAPCEHKADYNFRVVYEATAFPSQELRYTHPQTEGDRRFLAKVRREELFCLMNSDLVIAGSEVTRQFIQGLGVPNENLRVLRAPVNLSAYSPDVMGKPDGSPMRVIYLGSQVGYQGLPTLLRAMQHASRQADVRLAVVGPRHADWQAHLEDLVGELKLAGKVEFQQPVGHADLFKVLAAADVGVVPIDDVERNRAQGGALAKASEYLAAGRPVIAADLPVTRELLPEAATLFYPAGDFKELGERLIQLSRDPKQRVELGQKAREAAAADVDAAAIRGKLIDFYDQILGRPASAGHGEDDGAQTSVGTPTNRVKRDEDSKNGRVPKTDPAIRKPFEGESNEPTDPTSLLPLGPASPPDAEAPVVVGQQLDERSPIAGATEPEARAGSEPPVVMGLPLRDGPPPPEASAESEPVVIGRPLRDGPPPPEASAESEPVVMGRPLGEGPPEASAEPEPVVMGRPLVQPAPTEAPALTLEEDGSAEPTPPGRPGLTLGADGSTEPTPPPTESLADSPAEAHPVHPERGRGALDAEEPPSRGSPGLTTPNGPASSPAGAAGEAEPAPPAPAGSQEPTGLAAQAPAEDERPDGTPEPAPLSGAGLAPPPSSSAESDGAAVQGAASQGNAALPVSTAPSAGLSGTGGPGRAAASVVPIAGPGALAAAEARQTSQRPGSPNRISAILPGAPAPRRPETRPATPPVLRPVQSARQPPSPPRLVPVAPPPGPGPGDEPEEISNDEIMDADDAVVPEDAADLIEADGPGSTLDDDGPESLIDPWFAQLAHGYCPPEGAQFARHPPPTNFPGRDPKQ